MISALELDTALRTGAYRVGDANRRAVKCAFCGADCLPTQARKLHLTSREHRAVFLCVGACLPKATTT